MISTCENTGQGRTPEISCLKESARKTGYEDFISRPSIKIKTLWKPLIKEERQMTSETEIAVKA